MIISLAVSRVLGRLERLRAWILLDLDIPFPHADLRGLSWWRRLWARFTRASTWKEVAHHLLGLPVGAVNFALTLATWCVPLTLLTLPLYVRALPHDRADFSFIKIGAGSHALLAAAIGGVGVLFAPFVVRLLAAVDARRIRWFLGPPPPRAPAGPRGGPRDQPLPGRRRRRGRAPSHRA